MFIAIAGLAAHLPGVVASQTTLPVIGVAMPGGVADGLDALLAIVQMPKGVPVAAVGVGNGENAALLAAQILAVGDPALGRAARRAAGGPGQGDRRRPGERGPLRPGAGAVAASAAVARPVCGSLLPRYRWHRYRVAYGRHKRRSDGGSSCYERERARSAAARAA